MLFLFCFFNIWTRIYAFGCSDWLLMFWYFVFRCRRVYAPAVVSRAGQWEALRHRAPVSCHLPIIILLRTNRKTTTKTITKTKTMSVVICRWSYCSENCRPGLIWILEIIILCELRLLWQKKWSTKTYVSVKRHCWWQKGKGERREVRKEVKCSLPPLLFHLRDFTRPKICQVEYFLNSVKMYAATSGAGQKNRGGKETKKRRRWEGTKTFWIGPFDWNLLWINQYFCSNIVLMEHRCESSWIRL